MDKENIFKRPPERETEEKFFTEAFPHMPAKTGLLDSMDAITYMTDEAFVYYLPYFMECLLENSLLYDRLYFIVGVGLGQLMPESELKYGSELKKARQQLDEVTTKYY